MVVLPKRTLCYVQSRTRLKTNKFDNPPTPARCVSRISNTSLFYSCDACPVAGQAARVRCKISRPTCREDLCYEHEAKDTAVFHKNISNTPTTSLDIISIRASCAGLVDTQLLKLRGKSFVRVLHSFLVKDIPCVSVAPLDVGMGCYIVVI